MSEQSQPITWFNDSPDAGHPACICSLCGKGIGEHDAPAIRVFDDATNKEARFHRRCAAALGVVAPFPEDDLEIGFE